MSEAAENVIQLSGRLTLETAPALFSKGLQLAEGKSQLLVDFANVKEVDSSAVSLMLAWLRAAQSKKVKLSFINVPDNLRSLANLYGVGEALSLPVEIK
jgi:phospholipid transport system transporter-binding protein